MRLTVLAFVLSGVTWGAEPLKKLPDSDIVAVQRLQLQIAQAQSAQLQAEKVFKEAAESQRKGEAELQILVKALAEKQCKGCELLADMSWREPKQEKAGGKVDLPKR